ncbi:MAG: FHA domain-containing protein [Myxococcales bacterium]|nr:FHA domain-containing protein [Myxococcales bacterium]
MSNRYYVIEVKDGTGTAERHEVYDEVTILGRSQKRSQIVIPDSKASGQHVELAFRGGQVSVRDLGSTNGTFFDRHQVDRPFVLPPNGSFQIGDTNIRLVAVFGLEEEPAPRTVIQPAESVDSTRALSIEDLDRLRGSGLPSAPEPPRPSWESPRRVDPSEVRSRRPADPYSEASAGPASRPGPVAPDPRSMNPSALNQPADRTMAFDRASVEYGELDSSWRAPTGAQVQDDSDDAPPDWARKYAKAPQGGRNDDGDAPVRRGPPASARALAALAALGAAAILALMLLRPGGATDVPLPELGDSPEALAISASLSAAITTKQFVASEYRFASILGGDQYTTVEGHMASAQSMAAELVNADVDGTERVEAIAALMEKVAIVTATAGLLVERLDRCKNHLLISAGAALGVSLPIVFGMGGGLGLVAAILLMASGLLPLVLSQPAPVEPLYFTGIFTLLGLALIFKVRR